MRKLRIGALGASLGLGAAGAWAQEPAVTLGRPVPAASLGRPVPMSNPTPRDVVSPAEGHHLARALIWHARTPSKTATSIF